MYTAVLRDISTGTSYQIVRLVFRPYTHILPANWTSARHWSSIRVSADFYLYKYSSLSFGSHPHYYCIYIGYSFSPRNACGLLGPCFNTGQTSFAYFSCTFTLPKPNASFSTFARATFFSIGLSPYLAFDAHAAVRTALPSSTTLSIRGLFLGLSPILALLSISSSFPLRNALSSLPSELLPVQSPLLWESMFVSSPALSDMLKFRAYSYTIVYHLGTIIIWWFSYTLRPSSHREPSDPVQEPHNSFLFLYFYFHLLMNTILTDCFMFDFFATVLN